MVIRFIGGWNAIQDRWNVTQGVFPEDYTVPDIKIRWFSKKKNLKLTEN